MNGYKKIIVGFIALLFSITASGCGQIIAVARNDFGKTIDLAERYGKPEVKKCFSYLLTALDSIDASQGKLDQLLKEETEGLASAALKAVLIKEYLQSLNDPAKQAVFEKDFRANCNAMAGDMFLALVKDARAASKRLPGVR